jgi:seryl-tRNA synthetase
MLDIKYLRQNLAAVKKALAQRNNFQFDLERVLKLDEERRSLMARIEMLRAEQNKMAKAGKRSDRAVEIKRMLKDLEPQLAEAEENFKVEAVKLPNIPLPDVPEGKDSSQNKVIKTVGKIKLETGKNHIEIGRALDLIDAERAGKVSGSRFYYLKNEAVELEFALIKYALEIIKAKGFQPILPPVLIKENMAWGSGHFEAINDDAYHLRNDDLVAVGTAEQSILPYFAGEIVQNLPQRFVGFSTCLRREAGSYGKDVKGIFRAHQFDKVEMFTFSRPEDSEKEHDLIVELEEKIVSGLGLPYRLVSLCAGDLGLPAAKTIDLETWLPGQGQYRETHSASNCTDFQARRLNIRYQEGEKSGFVHTLNGTAVAIGRMLIAILENYQQKDGSVKVPEVLQKYLDFKEIKK